jgi:NAD+ synthase (glutamine-hydrolysing)
MKVTLAQINTTPNDFSGNFIKIQAAIDIAIKDKADVIVFPELTIPGYLVKDLVYNAGFVEKNLVYLKNVADLTYHSKVTVIVGYIDLNHSGFGKPFRNMAAVIQNGIVVATYQKRLLPGYDVFDEYRYFEPGTQSCIFNINGELSALTICEDNWFGDKGETGNVRYKVDPVKEAKELGVKYLFSINSSPFVHDKPHHRLEMLKNISEGLTLIYVNQIGGQDDLVFDGHSCVLRNGMVLECVPPSEDHKVDSQIVTVETNNNAHYIFDETTQLNEQTRIKNMYTMIVKGLYDYVTKSGFKEIVLGSSGGIDSALVASLACEAFGPQNVHCIMMPSVYSSEGSVNDAKQLHKNLGCKEYMNPISHENMVSTLLHNFQSLGVGGIKGYNASADENIQARMRGLSIMYFSNAFGALALTTANKTELSTGYFSIYGDSVGAYAPIADLYKMEVYALARYINKKHNKEVIPQAIIDKAPSAELKPGQTDEASLLPYPILDKIVKAYIEDYLDSFQNLFQYALSHCGVDDKSLCKWLETPNAESDFKRIIKLININEFKRRQCAPGIKLSKVAFGTGRRMPIVKKVSI